MNEWSEKWHKSQINAVFYIGNGFDVALGFKTKYGDFIKSDIFLNNLKGNSLMEFIKEKHDTNKNWSDIEMGLYLYSKEIAPIGKSLSDDEADKFESEFHSLTKYLHEYINSQTVYYDHPYLKKLNDEWKSTFDIKLVCCFNYTSRAVTFKLLDDDIRLAMVHGKVKPFQQTTDTQIVLGISQKMTVHPDHAFLYKRGNKNTKPWYWVEPDEKTCTISKLHNIKTSHNLDKAEIFVIYGCSLGESDDDYFRFLFNNIGNKKVLLYHFGVNEKKTMIARIKDMNSEYDLSNVVFIDSSINNGYRDSLRDLL